MTCSSHKSTCTGLKTERTCLTATLEVLSVTHFRLWVHSRDLYSTERSFNLPMTYLMDMSIFDNDWFVLDKFSSVTAKAESVVSYSGKLLDMAFARKSALSQPSIIPHSLPSSCCSASLQYNKSRAQTDSIALEGSADNCKVQALST